MVGLLIDDRPDEALSYIESAADFIAKMVRLSLRSRALVGGC